MVSSALRGGGLLAVLSDDRDEAAQLHAVGDQLVAAAGQRDRSGLSAPAQRQDQAAAVVQLVPPGGGDVPDADRGDDPVVRGVLRCAEQAVAFDHGDVLVPGGVEAGSGVQGYIGVDVDGRDASAVDELGQQGGVVAGAGTDLEDVVGRAGV